MKGGARASGQPDIASFFAKKPKPAAPSATAGKGGSPNENAAKQGDAGAAAPSLLQASASKRKPAEVRGGGAAVTGSVCGLRCPPCACAFASGRTGTLS